MLVMNIKKLEKDGFTPDSSNVKEIAYQLALRLDKKDSGDMWFTGLLKGNPELSQKKSE